MSDYVSTGRKLLAWIDQLNEMKLSGNPRPISLQLAPTNKCNLNCSYCSVQGRVKNLELELGDIVKVVDAFGEYLKAVEITGGGEPLEYGEINELIDSLYYKGLSVGLITNGIGLEDTITKDNLNKLRWIRISLNDGYEDMITIPELEDTVIGLSYVLNLEKFNQETINNIVDMVKDNKKIEYIRLVPNCLEDVNLIMDKLYQEMDTSEFGEKIFYHTKKPKFPGKCFFGYVKPYLYANGCIYPCNSLSLEKNAERDFPRCLAMCDVNTVGEWLKSDIKRGAMSHNFQKFCSECRFYNQNKLLQEIMEPEFEHVEHI